MLKDVSALNKNCILLKFQKAECFDIESDIYTLSIFGEDISKRIEEIKEAHLNISTVVVEQEQEFALYVGNLDEDPDWGDWWASVFLNFDKYEERFVTKTKEDWNDELISLVKERMVNKAFQSVTDLEFRKITSQNIQKITSNARLDENTKNHLRNQLNKIDNLTYGFYYEILMNYKMKE